MNDNSGIIVISCDELNPENALFLNALIPVIKKQFKVASVEPIKKAQPGTKGDLSVAIQIVLTASGIALPILYDIIKAVWGKRQKRKNEISLTVSVDRIIIEIIVLAFDDTKNTVSLTVKKDD
jgi:hypothetical protein